MSMTAAVYRRDDILVVPRNATLPDLCVCCGLPAHPKRTRQGFHWRPREYYLLWIYSWVGILILIMIARERMLLLVPLCPAHRFRNRMARWTGYALLIGAIPVASVMGAFMDSNNVDRVMEVVSLIAYSMIVVGLIVLILYRSPLRAAYISPTHGYFLAPGMTS